MKFFRKTPIDQEPRWIQFVLCRGVSVLFGLYAIAIVPVTIPQILDARASSEWPTTTATISKSRLQETKNLGKPSTFSADIKYRYEVEGQRYSSTTIRKGGIADRKQDEAEAWVERYPKGSLVEAYYKPSAPSNAVLIPGLHWTLAILPFTAIPAGLFAFGLWVMMPRKTEQGGGPVVADLSSTHREQD